MLQSVDSFFFEKKWLKNSEKSVFYIIENFIGENP